MPENQPQTNKERLKEITDGIEAGIRDMFQSEKYFQYLRTMSRFHKYSVNNTMLIYMQRPNATLVAGFNKWRDQFERHVIKGERGIRIIAPTPFKKKIEEEKLDPDTQLPVLDAEGKPVMEEKFIKIPMYKPVTVFDVSQTYGKPLPHLADELTGDVKNYEVFLEALRRSAPVPVKFAVLESNTDGFFSRESQDITLREGMSEVQTVCAAVHEIAHSMLHNYEKEKAEAAAGDENAEPVKPKDRNTEEVEAESISFSVCAYYGIDTGSNSLGYIATWSKNKELPELRASLETINRTASTLITDIDRNYAEICKERGIDRTEEEKTEETVEDTPDRFADDFCDFLDKAHESKAIEKPFSMDAKEMVPEVSNLLRGGTFEGTRETLLKAAQSGYDPQTVNELLNRLDALEKQWEASLQYQVKDYELSSGEHDLCCIWEYAPSDEGLASRGIVFVGSAALCQELAQKLNEHTMTAKEVREMEPETSDLPPAENKSFIDHFYVVDDLEHPGKLSVQFYDTIEEALDAYFVLPSDKVKALGIGNTNRLPGSLDFIQCKDGTDTPIEDYKTVEGWDNPEINAVVAKISEELSLRLEQAREKQEVVKQPVDPNLPDPAISIEAMNAYGYLSEDMLPLTKEMATELFDRGCTVYMLYEGNSEGMAFEPEDIQMHTGIFGITRDDWEEIRLTLPAPAKQEQTQQIDLEQKFLDGRGDSYLIYQLGPGESNHDIRFMNMDWMKEHDMEIRRENYIPVYMGDLPKYGTTEEKLEQLFEKFNMDRPADFTGHSLSVSDIVVLRQDGVLSSHYVDSIGFSEVQRFLAPENYLKNAEMAMEDDYGMIDGIINNGPKEPTSAELEAQAKAGQAVSVMEMANALRREQGQQKKQDGKKPSVLAKLRAYKSMQAAQTPERKSAEREL